MLFETNFYRHEFVLIKKFHNSTVAKYANLSLYHDITLKLKRCEVVQFYVQEWLINVNVSLWTIFD